MAEDVTVATGETLNKIMTSKRGVGNQLVFQWTELVRRLNPHIAEVRGSQGFHLLQFKKNNFQFYHYLVKAAPAMAVPWTDRILVMAAAKKPRQ